MLSTHRSPISEHPRTIEPKSMSLRGPFFVSSHGPTTGERSPVVAVRMVSARKKAARDQPRSSSIGMTKTLTPQMPTPVWKAPLTRAMPTMYQP